MSQILFIANEPCVVALIERLQPLVEPTICLESDYTGGIKSIFDTHPAVVFLQNRIGAVSCEKLASQVKMLLDGEAVPLVLLSDEAMLSSRVNFTYEACFDLCLPLDELSWQVQQLLHTLPNIAWKDPAITAPLLSPADFLADPFAIDALPPILAEAPPQQQQQQQQEQRQNPIKPSLRTPVPAPAAAAEQRPYTDSRRIEKADPWFGSMSESHAEPTFTKLKQSAPKAARPANSAQAGSAGTAPHHQKPGRAVPPAASARRPLAPASQALQEQWSAGNDLPDSIAATLGIGKKDPRIYRVLIVGILLVLCIATVVLFYIWYHGARVTGTRSGTDNLRGKSAAAQPVSQSTLAEQLPLFIPRVPPDAGYAAGHPGWERYYADRLDAVHEVWTRLIPSAPQRGSDRFDYLSSAFSLSLDPALGVRREAQI